MTTIVIFDDDAHSIAHIRSLVEQCMPADISFSIHGAQTLDQLTALLSQGIHIDILLSDIAMPEGQPSGIEVVQRLFPAESGTQVIYVSGFLHQATEVYRTAHIYFLLKPIEPEKLREALARLHGPYQQAPRYAACEVRPPRASDRYCQHQLPRESRSQD